MSDALNQMIIYYYMSKMIESNIFIMHNLMKKNPVKIKKSSPGFLFTIIRRMAVHSLPHSQPQRLLCSR